jgi:hypothetical protein
MGNDHPFALQFQVCPLDRDHTDAKRGGKLAYGGDFLPLGPLPNRYPLLDLLHDLQIHGATIRLRNEQITVHVYILSIFKSKFGSQDKSSATLGKAGIMIRL